MIDYHRLTDVGAQSPRVTAASWCWADKRLDNGRTIDCTQTTVDSTGLCEMHRAEIIGPRSTERQRLLPG